MDNTKELAKIVKTLIEVVEDIEVRLLTLEKDKRKVNDEA